MCGPPRPVAIRLDNCSYGVPACCAEPWLSPVEVVYTVVHWEPVRRFMSTLTGTFWSSSCLTFASICRHQGVGFCCCSHP